jgi:molybdate transport system ATP-binding protein
MLRSHALTAVSYPRGFDIDRLLVDICERLAGAGLRLGGLLQLSTGERGGSCATGVVVVDLRTGARFDIWQDRGPCARGCRLDEGGLAEAEIALRSAIADRVDLLVVNRFGRAESLGRGVRARLEEAVLEDIPVLTAVRAPYDVAWQAFHGGLGHEIGCDGAAVAAWIAAVTGEAGRARAHGPAAAEAR